MSRLSRWTLNAVTMLSLGLSVAAIALWLDHRVRTRPGTVIRSGMELEVMLTGVPCPSSQLVTVDLSGRIDLPPFGEVNASGLTCAELASQIENTYQRMGSLYPLGFDVRVRGFRAPSALGMGLLLAIPALRLLHNRWLLWRKRRRLNARLCWRCSYDLRGNVSGVCPECGTAVPKSAAAISK
jgi:hypothetical protein